jgi:putative chitinase
VLHHTAGEGTAQDVMNVLNNRSGGALGVQFIIDKEGNLFKGLPTGTKGKHVDSSKQTGAGPSDLTNSTSQGVEIIGSDDTKINLYQCRTALLLVRSLGYSKENIYAHGEIQSNKMASEGATCKRYILKYWSTPDDKLPVEDLEITKQKGTKGPTESKPIKTDKIDLSKISLTQNSYKGQAASNINMLIGKLKDKGITNPIVQAAILATIGKESGFIPQNEIGYCNTSDSRIVKIFSDRGRKCKSLKCDNEQFFDCVYGKDSGVTLGNTQPGDGYKYRGRGFNQITGRGNYKKYGYESNPDQLNDTEGAADAAINFLASEGSSLNNRFKNVDDAVTYFVTKNAGGRRSSMGERKAKEVLAKFNVGSGSAESVSYDDLTNTTDTKPSGSETSGEDKSKLNVLDLMGLGGLNAMISLAKGDQEGFKKNIEKQEALKEETNRIKDIIKKIL